MGKIVSKLFCKQLLREAKPPRTRTVSSLKIKGRAYAVVLILAKIIPIFSAPKGVESPHTSTGKIQFSDRLYNTLLKDTNSSSEKTRFFPLHESIGVFLS